MVVPEPCPGIDVLQNMSDCALNHSLDGVFFITVQCILCFAVLTRLPVGVQVAGTGILNLMGIETGNGIDIGL